MGRPDIQGLTHRSDVGRGPELSDREAGEEVVDSRVAHDDGVHDLFPIDAGITAELAHQVV
jgi:hypothetical protein